MSHLSLLSARCELITGVPQYASNQRSQCDGARVHVNRDELAPLIARPLLVWWRIDFQGRKT
jgi:hypothetical protein